MIPNTNITKYTFQSWEDNNILKKKLCHESFDEENLNVIHINYLTLQVMHFTRSSYQTQAKCPMYRARSILV